MFDYENKMMYFDNHQIEYSLVRNQVSRVMRKLTFCICENKDADQLRGNRWFSHDAAQVKNETSKMWARFTILSMGCE